MKTSRDPRHLKRVAVIKGLFTWGFNQKNPPETETAKKVIDHLEKIDREIAQSAPTWPVKQINRIDLAILRLAIFELIIEKKQSYRVIADEAVELAKEFGSESSPAFINGVLGKVIEKHKIYHG